MPKPTSPDPSKRAPDLEAKVRGLTPLGHAIGKSTVAAVRELLQRGAKLDAEHVGEAPVHLALRTLSPSTELITLLLEAGAAIDAPLAKPWKMRVAGGPKGLVEIGGGKKATPLTVVRSVLAVRPDPSFANVEALLVARGASASAPEPARKPPKRPEPLARVDALLAELAAAVGGDRAKLADALASVPAKNIGPWAYLTQALGIADVRSALETPELERRLAGSFFLDLVQQRVRHVGIPNDDGDGKVSLTDYPKKHSALLSRSIQFAFHDGGVICLDPHDGGHRVVWVRDRAVELGASVAEFLARTVERARESG
jgi:hypothetical protein